MAIKFSDRVFGANVSTKIIKKFKELAGGGLSGIDTLPLESRNPTFEKYLGDRTTFARMWTANLISGSTQVIYYM